MDERMTICNMSIEGGARIGYVNPDETTFDVSAWPSIRAGRRRVRPRVPVVAESQVGCRRGL